MGNALVFTLCSAIFLLAGYLGRDEIEVQLLVPDGVDVPAAWTAELPDATVAVLVSLDA